MTKTAQSYARLYAQGRVDAAGLARAVQRGLLTQEQANGILAQQGGAAQSGTPRLEAACEEVVAHDA